MGVNFDLSRIGCHVSLASAAISLSSSIQEISIFPVPYGQGDDFGTLAACDDDDPWFLAGLYVSEYSEKIPRITWWKTSTLIIHGGIIPETMNEITVHESELAVYLGGLAFFLAGSFDWNHREWFTDRSRLSPQPEWALFDKRYVWSTKADLAYDNQRAAAAKEEKGL